MRNYLARLDGTTGQADAYDANANNIVRSIALLPDGKFWPGASLPTSMASRAISSPA